MPLNLRERSSWEAMWNRCTNPNARQYPRYGGRGIDVCERWKDFQAFLADMGPRPTWQTLDRINNDGPYGPSNCRWATAREQAANRCDSAPIIIDGVSRLACEWAEISGLPVSTIHCRVYRGWPAQRAVFAPYGQRRVDPDSAIDLYRQGLSLRAVGEVFGVTPSGIRGILKRRNALRGQAVQA